MDIVALFYDLDKFAVAFEQQWKRHLLPDGKRHRPMKPDELQKKLGPFFGKYKVHEHHYLDRSQLHDFGKAHDGTPVTAKSRRLQVRLLPGTFFTVPNWGALSGGVYKL